MFEFLRQLLESDFMPHGSCYFWQPEILWLHTVSDALIALAYYSIPAALWYFVKKREDLTFSWIFVLFGAFIFACGTTHLLGLWTTWHATYRLEGMVKLLTAIISVGTAIVLWPLIPRALALPSPRQLEASNRALQKEIKERQLAEQQARLHLEQLAHVDRMGTLGEMAASIGHELHQPLGAIVNFANGCERSLAAGSEPQDLAGVLKKISQQAERAAEIVRRTRAFSSRRALQNQSTDLNELLHEVADLLDVLVRQSQVEVVFDLEPDLPKVLLDRIQMQQVVVNLVKNGIEAMEDLPKERRRLSIQSRPTSEGGLEILVTDRGRGSSLQEIERLFEPFYSTKADGMGMGLAISRSITEAHGGTLAATDNPDHGLTFRITLPIHLNLNPDA